MLNFNQIEVDIQKAFVEHSHYICEAVYSRIDDELDVLLNEFLNQKKDDLGDEIDNSVQSIIEAKPEVQNLINKRFVNFVNSKSKTHFDNITYDEYIFKTSLKNKPSKVKIHDFFSRVNSVFSYKSFGNSNYSKYNLTFNLGARTCMYCNRISTHTHYKSDGSALMNPQVDHWLPKSKYPLLQLSFFNLIPSCEICNARVKKVREFIENEHVHPYDEQYDEFRISYRFNSELNDYKIIFDNDGDLPNKTRKTFEYMFIDEMYDAHISDLKDLIKIKEVYGDTYMEKLKISFPNINITDDDRFRLAFGVELDSRKFHLNPLSKFKYDILKELGIIKTDK